MKRFLTLTLAVLALATLSVSCNKDGDKNKGLGFWQVESAEAGHTTYSNLFYAWYYYDAEKDGYEVLFLPKDDLDNVNNYDYAYVDMPKSLCGAEHNLSDNLSTTTWNFFSGTKSFHIANKMLTGKVFLSVSKENNNVIFRLEGTSDFGDKVKIDYVGYASPVDHFLVPIL